MLVEDHLELHGGDPFLALHDEDLQSGDVAKHTGGVVGANAEEVLRQLLCDGRCAACVVVQHIVFQGGKETDGVDALMIEETLVLGVDEGTPKLRVHLLVLHRLAVFVEELSEEHSVGAIYL